MSKISEQQVCPVCGLYQLTVWVEETVTGLRPGRRSWIDPGDNTHLASHDGEAVGLVPDPDPVPDQGGEPVPDPPPPAP